MAGLTVISEQCSFAGLQGFYSHESEVCGGTMTFSLFRPPQATEGKAVPLVTYLSGLTCTAENFTTKAGAQRVAADGGPPTPGGASPVMSAVGAEDGGGGRRQDPLVAIAPTLGDAGSTREQLVEHSGRGWSPFSHGGVP